MADGPRLYMRRKGETLIPDDKWSADRITEHLSDGRLYLVRTESARNGKQHRLLWALAHKIHENTEFYASPDHVVDQFKRATGHLDVVQYIDAETGEITTKEELRSISYAAMTQEEFQVWFDRVLDFVVQHIWPGLDKLSIRCELDEMIGITSNPVRAMKATKALEAA